LLYNNPVVDFMVIRSGSRSRLCNTIQINCGGSTMSKPSRSFIAFACVILALAVLACSLGSLATQPSAPVIPATNSELGSGTAFTLTLPDGQAVSLQATCAGVNSGGYLDIRATNTDDETDPKRVVVKVGGTYAAVGQLENMYVEITIGAADAWTFMGNTPSAILTLNADGSGSFGNVAIVNATGTSASYNAGGEYKFSAQWKCTP
jgi:hypothetical protein